MMHSAVRPYLMDLGSANGTYLNNERIEGERYYELLERVSLSGCKTRRIPRQSMLAHVLQSCNVLGM